jgi:SET domain-containing protein
MLMIPVEVRKSEIHGQGIFALHDIRESAVIWQFEPGLDRRVSLFAIKHTEPRMREYIMERGYINPHQPDQFVLCLDAAQFLNFAPIGQKPNLALGGIQDGEHILLAAVDISAGTELTVPPESDLDFERKLTVQHELRAKS